MCGGCRCAAARPAPVMLFCCPDVFVPPSSIDTSPHSLINQLARTPCNPLLQPPAPAWPSLQPTILSPLHPRSTRVEEALKGMAKVKGVVVDLEGKRANVEVDATSTADAAALLPRWGSDAHGCCSSGRRAVSSRLGCSGSRKRRQPGCANGLPLRWCSWCCARPLVPSAPSLQNRAGPTHFPPARLQLCPSHQGPGVRGRWVASGGRLFKGQAAESLLSPPWVPPFRGEMQGSAPFNGTSKV
jgi:hypothetical protein